MENPSGPPRTVRVPIGERVAGNIARIRQSKGMSQSDLVAKLQEHGLSYAVSAISKIEKGQRKLDPDDLVGIAVALGTTPNALMFGVDLFLGPKPLAVTPTFEAEMDRVWAWADGEFPLGSATPKEQLEFQRKARPHLPPVISKDLPQSVRNAEPSKNLEDAYKAAAKYFERDRTVLDLLMGELRRELEEPFDFEKWFGDRDVFTSDGDDQHA